MSCRISKYLCPVGYLHMYVLVSRYLCPAGYMISYPLCTCMVCSKNMVVGVFFECVTIPEVTVIASVCFVFHGTRISLL